MPTDVSLFLARSSSGSHANHIIHSEQFRSQENNRVFFTSNSNDVHAYEQTMYSEAFY